MAHHVLIQDPSSISGRFSNSQRLGHEDDDLNDLIEEKFAPEEEFDLIAQGQSLEYGAVEMYLHRIPPREADLIRLYYRDKMKQEQIAKLFKITQAAVSYRLHRGIKRIQFLRTIPVLDYDIFELELGPKFSDQDREILWRMYETTCQSEIAKQMGLTQGRVRHRFFRALQHIKELIKEEARAKQLQIQMMRKQGKSEEDIDSLEDMIDSKYGKYWTVFFAISDKHFNILHEVSLPQFRDRGDAQILPIE